MNRWFSRGLIVLVLASLLGGGLTALASPPAQDQAISVTLYDGASQGLLSYEARGRGVASGAMIDLTVTNLSGKPLEVLVPPATRFVPTQPPAETSSLLPPSARLRLLPGAAENSLLRPLFQGGGQSGGATGNDSAGSPLRLMMPAALASYPKGIGRPVRQVNYPTVTVTLEAYCLNAHLDNPSASTLFTALPPENDEISRLIQAYNARSGGVSVVAMQIAVWILTNDVDLAFLEQVGYNPTDAELRDALLLLQEAGIDISDKQLGQIDLPPAPTPTPMFMPGQSTTARLRGSVVNEAREPVENALVLVAAIGPDRTRRSFDVTSERGRFETLLQLTETDNVIFTVRINNRAIGELEIPGADALTLAAQGGELLLIVSGGTPPPTSTPIPMPTPTQTPEGGAAGATPLAGPLFAVRLTQGVVNIRSEASTSSAVAGSLACGGAVAALDAQLVDADGYTWYHLAAGGWVRSDVVRTFGSQAEAEAAAANSQAVCNPPTPVPTPAPVQDAGGGSGGGTGGQPGGDSGSGGGAPVEPPPPPPPPTTNFNVTIINNASCTISGSLGPAGYSVGAGGSTTVSVPQGSHGFSGSGDCGSVAPATYTIDGDATITIG